MKTNLVILLVLFVLFNNSLAATPDDDILDAANKGDLPKIEAALKAGADVNAKTNEGDTALMAASFYGHLEVIKLLYANNADVNAKTKIGTTALIWASENSHLEIVKWLIANNADVNAKTNSGVTALIMASEKGNLEIVKYLIANNADVNAKYTDGWTALILASRKGHLEIVKLLIANNADVNAKDNNGWTALVRASAIGHLETVKWLIANKADVNAKDSDDGKTALIWAYDKGHLEIVKWLIANNADVNASDKYGETALLKASQNGHLEIVKLLIENKADVNAGNRIGIIPLIAASDSNSDSNLEILKLLIENNADVNATDVDGGTALMSAASRPNPNHLAIVKLLIEHKADVNAKFKGKESYHPHFYSEGDTPLLIACTGYNVYNGMASSTSFLQIIQFLIKSGADINMQNTFGETPLYRVINGSSEVKNFEFVKVLLANKADVNVKITLGGIGTSSYIFKGETAFLASIRRGNNYKLLIENGADINDKDFFGRTALMLTSDLEIAKLLIEKNVDVNARDNEGKTALMLASENGHLETVKLLIANKADVNAKNNDGWTALMSASRNGHLEIVKLLIANKADVNAKNDKGDRESMWAAYDNSHTALQLAQAKKHYPTVEYLKQQEALLAKAKNIKNETGEKIKLPEWEQIQSMLEPLVFKKDYPAIEKYFKNKNANSYSESGESFLHSAMRLGDVKYTDILLKKGAKPENLDNDGSSALHIAAEKGQVNLIPLLIKDKSLLTQKNVEGKSALAVSLENKKGSASSLLLGLEKEEEIKFPVYYSKFFTNLNLSFHLQGKERQAFQNLLLEKYLDVLKKSKTNTKEISSLIWFIYKVKGETLKAKELEKKLDSNIPLVSIFANINNDNSVFAGIRTRLYEVGADYFTLQNKWKDAEVFRLQVANRQYPLTAKKTPTRKESKIKKQGNLFPNEYSALDLVTQSMIEEKKEENPIQLVVQSFHTESPTQIAFNQEGNFFLTSSEDRTVKLFSDTNAKVLREYQSHDESVNAISFHPDGLQFVSGASDGILGYYGD